MRPQSRTNALTAALPRKTLRRQIPPLPLSVPSPMILVKKANCSLAAFSSLSYDINELTLFISDWTARKSNGASTYSAAGRQLPPLESISAASPNGSYLQSILTTLCSFVIPTSFVGTLSVYIGSFVDKMKNWRCFLFRLLVDLHLNTLPPPSNCENISGIRLFGVHLSNNQKSYIDKLSPYRRGCSTRIYSLIKEAPLQWVYTASKIFLFGSWTMKLFTKEQREKEI